MDAVKHIKVINDLTDDIYEAMADNDINGFKLSRFELIKYLNEI